MSSYPASVVSGNRAVAGPRAPARRGGPVGAGAGGLPAGMVAVRVADVAGGAGGGRSALVVAGAGRVRSGQPLAFCHPVAVAPAMVRRDGRVLAGGWLPDHARLGLLEPELGEGVVEQVVATDDQVRPAERQRIMSAGLTARLVIAMTLMPEASAREVLARLVGLLAKVPFARAWKVPGAKVITAWRRRLGAGVMEALFWRAAGPITTVGDPDGLLGDLLVCAVDGFQARRVSGAVGRNPRQPGTLRGVGDQRRRRFVPAAAGGAGHCLGGPGGAGRRCGRQQRRGTESDPAAGRRPSGPVLPGPGVPGRPQLPRLRADRRWRR